MDFSSLPSVDRVLNFSGIVNLVGRYGRTAVRDVIRELLDEERVSRVEGNANVPRNEQWFEQQCKKRLEDTSRSPLRPVFNLTGTVLHTNLGRAILPPDVNEFISTITTQACNLEYDLDVGSRGDRDNHIESLICGLTGAEAATVVNNNAAAVLIVLNTLANGREVIVSRGELIEIGGSFRMPDIMLQAGCRLYEVGTTNRTHLKDYSNAISGNTGLLMKVHCSNYQIKGFSSSVREKELVKLGKEKNIPVIVDLGSGSLIDLKQWGLPEEPTVQQTLADGADIVTFSGDKLLGGPQAGIIVGQKNIIEKIKKNALKRALRLDKIIIAALVKVLQLYQYPEKIAERLPTLRMLARPLSDIEAQVNRLIPYFIKVLDKKAKIEVRPCASQIGSGSLPIETLPSLSIAILPLSSEKHVGRFLQKFSKSFARLPVPVIGRIKDDAFCLDLRCLESEASFLEQLKQLEL